LAVSPIPDVPNKANTGISVRARGNSPRNLRAVRYTSEHPVIPEVVFYADATPIASWPCCKREAAADHSLICGIDRVSVIWSSVVGFGIIWSCVVGVGIIWGCVVVGVLLARSVGPSQTRLARTTGWINI
jgi:hypothetical protein